MGGMTLNAYGNGGFKSLKLWLWTPKREIALKAYGSKRLWKKMVTLNTEMVKMALDAYEKSGGFERLWEKWL